MAQKKTAAPRATSKKTSAAPAVAPEVTWQALEQQLRDTLGQDAVGQYPADLEPLHMTFERAPDTTGMLPEAYQRFTEALGFRWVTTGKKALAFLPPRWRVQASQGMGVPERSWTQVREEREAGHHAYRFLMFASEDLHDVNGYCFGKSEHDDSLVVWEVEDSLPLRELGPFTPWLAKKLAPLSKAVAKPPRRGAPKGLGDPLGLEQESHGEVSARIQEQAAADILGTFPRDTRSILLQERRLGVLPDMVREFTALEQLTLMDAQLTRVSPALARLTQLTQLDLSWNKGLDALPPELEQLQNLESLTLDRTGLRVVPEWIGRLPRLSALSLKATPITTLPAWVSRIPNLKSLDVSLTCLPSEEVDAFKHTLPECQVRFP